MGAVVDLGRARAARLLPAWRAMRPEDLGDVALVAVFCGRAHGDVPLPSALTGCLVLEARGVMAGYLAVAPSRHGTLVVSDLCLLPEHRSKGLASLAVGIVVSWAAALGFCAVELMARDGSDGFWSRMCFVSVAGSGPEGPSRMVRSLQGLAVRA